MVMINICSFLYKVSKNCFVLTFVIMLNGILLLPIIITIFHPDKFNWVNYWAFIKAGTYTLFIFGIFGAIFNRFQHSEKKLKNINELN